MSTITTMAAMLLASNIAVGAVPAAARESLVAASARSARELAENRTLPVASVQDDWRRVFALNHDSDVRVVMLDGSSREGRLERVTDDRISIAPRQGSAPVDLRRVDIAKVQRPTKGSILGGVIGAAAGAFLGVGAAVTLATKQCGDTCADEKVLIGVSLVGLPAAGGFLGAKLMPRAKWTDVYERR